MAAAMTPGGGVCCGGLATPCVAATGIAAQLVGGVDAAITGKGATVKETDAAAVEVEAEAAAAAADVDAEIDVEEDDDDGGGTGEGVPMPRDADEPASSAGPPRTSILLHHLLFLLLFLLFFPSFLFVSLFAFLIRHDTPTCQPINRRKRGRRRR